jgi:glycosyltransferase involved in cell wall biosynthesis
LRDYKCGMVNSLNFVLPADKSMASIQVRAKALAGYNPENWDFNFIDNASSKIKFFFFSELFENLLIIINIIQSFSYAKRKQSVFYFIKPKSPLLIFFVRYVLGLKVFIDVNDPLHLRPFLGRFAKVKFILMTKFANGVIFESSEYRHFCKKWVSKNVCTIEDTPQFEISFINFKSRKLDVVWFGSAATSKTLIEYIQHLKILNAHGFRIIFLGIDDAVLSHMSECGIRFDSIPHYDHNTLLDTCSQSILSFVPMPKIDSFEMRGNLKAKFSMAAGCVTIASSLKMHQRLIDHGQSGFLFNNLEDFSLLCERIMVDPYCFAENIGSKANKKIMDDFNRQAHAKKLCEFFDLCT